MVNASGGIRMITYTIPFSHEKDCPGSATLLSSLRGIFFENEAPVKKIPRLFRVLREFFPMDSLLMTYTRNQPLEQWHYLYPETSSQRHTLLTTQEQLHAISIGPRNIIRIADENDYTVTTGIIGKVLPSQSFSTIFIRTLLPENVIIAFALIHKGSDAVFRQHHAELLSLIFEELLPFFHRICEEPPRRPHVIAPENDLRFLPLTKLPGMRQVLHQVWKVARQDCPVLLLGETGSGKEATADTLYRASARVGAPFIKMNCGSLPETLMDSELFGHEQGAFTGAIHLRKGVFERAHRGVLMLDEVGELPLQAQTRLLRVLQEGTFERVGGTVSHFADVRIIAATHRDIFSMVKEKSFRADLHYRLNVFPIYVPPLRERPEDIPLLTRFLVEQKCRRFGMGMVPQIRESCMKRLLTYPWPGNIRELNNAVERAVILWNNDPGSALHIMPEGDIVPVSSPYLEPLCSLDEANRRHIRKALDLCGGKISGAGGAAELLEVPANTLRSRMARLGMDI